jgi:hypothetical protein
VHAEPFGRELQRRGAAFAERAGVIDLVEPDDVGVDTPETLRCGRDAGVAEDGGSAGNEITPGAISMWPRRWGRGRRPSLQAVARLKVAIRIARGSQNSGVNTTRYGE